MAIAWIAAHFAEIVPGFSLQVTFGGSLHGLIALAEGEADIAGCHLWDEETETFNLSFVRRIMPGKRTALVTLAHRKIGLIVSPGNPKNLADLPDLFSPGLRFVNRQSGSGTRVWLDSALRRRNLDPARIRGYEIEKHTHSDVARAIAEGEADVGLGLEAAARAFALDFVPLTEERYELAIPERKAEHRAVRRLLAWLSSAEASSMISALAGYDAREVGRTVWTD
jgi:putative molybdopterin biosynthesis protein